MMRRIRNLHFSQGFGRDEFITFYSTATKSKVIDTNCCSKKCSKYQETESLRHVNFDLFSTFW